MLLYDGVGGVFYEKVMLVLGEIFGLLIIGRGDWIGVFFFRVSVVCKIGLNFYFVILLINNFSKRFWNNNDGWVWSEVFGRSKSVRM